MVLGIEMVNEKAIFIKHIFSLNTVINEMGIDYFEK